MAGSRTFRALQERNARLFYTGLLVSNTGTWLQSTALVLVVRRLGGTGVELGLILMFQFLPMLLFGLMAGAYADRVNRRRLTIITQSAMAVQALALAVVDFAGHATIPFAYGVSLVLGVLGAIDNPARRGMVTELVDEPDLPNALSLNTAVMTGSRIFGPSLAAVLSSTIGTAWCFLLNALSFVAIVGALVAIDPRRLRTVPPRPRGGRPVREGLAAVWRDPVTRRTLCVFTIVATFAFNYSVALPLIVRFHLEAPDEMFGWLLSATSVGSVMGSLAIARLYTVGEKWVYGTLGVLVAAGTVLSWTPSTVLAMIAGVALGFGGAAFIAAANVVFQTRTPAQMRGRVLALTAVAFLGSTPIGSPITGLIGDTWGAGWSLFYGTAIAGACLVVMVVRLGRHRAPVVAVPSPG